MAKNKAAKAAADVAAAVANAVAAGAEAEDDESPEEDRRELGPLFNLDDADQRRHEKTRVYRLEPINEGMLDGLSPDCTEDEIRDRWGGGKYRLEAVESSGKIIAKRTVKIAGDPIFDNDIAQRQYDRWQLNRYGKATPPAPVGTDGVGDQASEERHRRTLERIRLEIEAKEQAEERRRSREREERDAEYRRISDERKAEREREEAVRRAEREEREAREDRRWREERSERERERQERMEADERRWRAEQELRKQELENQRDPTQILMQGLQLGAQMAGGGESDNPVAAFLNRAPELIAAGKDLIASGSPAPARAAARPSAPPKGQAEPLTIHGPLAESVHRRAAQIAKAGGNPNEVISRAITKALDDIGPKVAAKSAATVTTVPVVPVKRGPGRPRKVVA